MQYAATFPLHSREVVLTFDDGPMLPMTTKVLEALRNECVRATFFLVGRNARSSPAVVRQIAGEGHTIGNHTENHHLVTLAGPHGVQELDKGFRSIADVLEPAGVQAAPFFRFPGLLNTHPVEIHAKAKGVLVMSADMVADDWTGPRPEHIIARAIARLQQKGSGILLLHDVLLRELKTRGGLCTLSRRPARARRQRRNPSSPNNSRPRPHANSRRAPHQRNPRPKPLPNFPFSLAGEK